MKCSTREALRIAFYLVVTVLCVWLAWFSITAYLNATPVTVVLPKWVTTEAVDEPIRFTCSECGMSFEPQFFEKHTANCTWKKGE